MRKLQLRQAFFACCLILLAALLLSGCCGYTGPTENSEDGTSQGTSLFGNRQPAVDLSLTEDSGPTPFYPEFHYSYSDPDGNLETLELKIDGQVFAQGNDSASLLPDDFVYPDFYKEAEQTVGKHTLEIVATDSEGLAASKSVTFTVLQGLSLSKPGWYVCNSKPDNPPCDTMLEIYCDKFDESDLAVRQAAAQAISKHPGAFSINQLLDIYDWVHANVFYQNVPFGMGPPYYPNQTLATKSGDCKNQAVLIASMVEAIGGSARVLLIPDCHHAFAEVYIGTDINTSSISNAIFSHYNTNGNAVTYHKNKNSENGTDYWYIFDTAGGNFPGETIPECFKANQTFEIRDCNRPLDALHGAESQGTAYGPYTNIDDTKVLQPGGGWNYWHDPKIGTGKFKWCHYKLTLASLSPKPLDWHLTDETGYQNSQARRSYSYFYGEEQVLQSNYEFDWASSQRFYTIVENSNKDSSITVKIQMTETCYNG